MTTFVVLEEIRTTPDGTTTTRRMEVQCTPEQVALLIAGPIAPKKRTWDDALPEILWRQQRIREREKERSRQAQKAVCAPSRSPLQDFYEMLG